MTVAVAAAAAAAGDPSAPGSSRRCHPPKRSRPYGGGAGRPPYSKCGRGQGGYGVSSIRLCIARARIYRLCVFMCVCMSVVCVCVCACVSVVCVCTKDIKFNIILLLSLPLQQGRLYYYC